MSTVSTITPPICTLCRHYKNGPFCDAFPDGIPTPIWRSEVVHTSPYPGDHDIQFELDEIRSQLYGETVRDGKIVPIADG